MQEMKPIEFQFKLPADIETSWKWLTEESFQKKWMTGLISLKREDGSCEYEPGTRWHMVMQEGKKQKDYYATMPEVDRPNRFTLAIEAENLAPGGKILVEYRLTSFSRKSNNSGLPFQTGCRAFFVLSEALFAADHHNDQKKHSEDVQRTDRPDVMSRLIPAESLLRRTFLEFLKPLQ